MAKKARTPPPPKRGVQAPQRRDRREPSEPSGRPARFWVAVGAGVAVIAAVVVVVIVVSGGGSKTTKTTATSFNTLPGIRRTKAPWSSDVANLADKLQPLGLSQLSAE